MSKNKRIIALTEDRRPQRKAAISSIYVKGYTIKEIIAELFKKGITNKYGEAYSITTICKDIKELCEEWRQQSFKNINQYKCKIWAELQAIKKEGWQNKEYHLILHVIKQERELLGLDEIKNEANIKELPQIVYIKKDEVNINFINNNNNEESKNEKEI